MSESLPKGPLDEQAICITCGFCCDGTLFLHAHLDPGERGNMPEEIEQDSYTDGEKDYFRLPCHYFSEKCIIYDRKRANICFSYRCQLLKDFATGKIALNDAQKIIRKAMRIRTDIMNQFRLVSGNCERISFRQLLVDLGKILDSAGVDDLFSQDYEMLLTRCNIFQALLIKHIRSSADFENIMITLPLKKI